MKNNNLPMDIESKTLSLSAQAMALNIHNNESLARANEMLLVCKSIEKEIASVFDPLIKSAYDTYKKISEQKKGALEPVKDAEIYLKSGIAKYISEQEAKRKAEEERIKQEMIKAEEARKKKEVAQLLKKGLKDEAESLKQEPVNVPHVVLEKATPKLEGVSIREGWSFRIVNENLIPREYLTPDMKKIGGVVRAMKGATNIPGIEVFPVSQVAARAE